MKKTVFVSVAVIYFTLTIVGCSPTHVTYSVTETIGPDGKKTVSTTKTITQYVEVPKRDKIDEVLVQFK